MKLLFDQNLSPRLPRLLSDIYADTAHVREIGLRDASDIVIWEHAKENGFAIVSKDSDFQQRSLLLGSPPKFIWLRVGNCPVKTVEDLLRRHSVAEKYFVLHWEILQLALAITILLYGLIVLFQGVRRHQVEFARPAEG
jgi:predicted nuclease of predicted toxin-antitoxin system